MCVMLHSVGAGCARHLLKRNVCIGVREACEKASTWCALHGSAVGCRIGESSCGISAVIVAVVVVVANP